MIRIFVRQLFQKQFTILQLTSDKNNLRTIANASLRCGYCNLSNEIHTTKVHKDEVAKQIKQMKNLFKCTDNEAEQIIQQIALNDLKLFRKKFTFLIQNGATLHVLMEHCYLFNMSIGKCTHRKAFRSFIYLFMFLFMFLFIVYFVS